MNKTVVILFAYLLLISTNSFALFSSKGKPRTIVSQALGYEVNLDHPTTREKFKEFWENPLSYGMPAVENAIEETVLTLTAALEKDCHGTLDVYDTKSTGQFVHSTKVKGAVEVTAFCK